MDETFNGIRIRYSPEELKDWLDDEEKFRAIEVEYRGCKAGAWYAMYRAKNIGNEYGINAAGWEARFARNFSYTMRFLAFEPIVYMSLLYKEQVRGEELAKETSAYVAWRMFDIAKGNAMVKQMVRPFREVHYSKGADVYMYEMFLRYFSMMRSSATKHINKTYRMKARMERENNDGSVGAST